MNVRLGEYGIRTLDRLQVVLCEYKTVQDKESENYGQEREIILGYYGNTGTALKKLYELLVRRSEAKTAKKLLDAFKASEQAVEKMVEECRKMK